MLRSVRLEEFDDASDWPSTLEALGALGALTDLEIIDVSYSADKVTSLHPSPTQLGFYSSLKILRLRFDFISISDNNVRTLSANTPLLQELCLHEDKNRHPAAVLQTLTLHALATITESCPVVELISLYLDTTVVPPPHAEVNRIDLAASEACASSTVPCVAGDRWPCSSMGSAMLNTSNICASRATPQYHQEG